MTSSATADAIGVKFLFTYRSPHRLRPRSPRAGHFFHWLLHAVAWGRFRPTKGRTFFSIQSPIQQDPTNKTLHDAACRTISPASPSPKTAWGKCRAYPAPHQASASALRPSSRIPFGNVAL